MKVRKVHCMKLHNVPCHHKGSAEAYSERCQTSKMKLLAKLTSSAIPLTISVENSVLCV